ncbi:formyltransferase family protein, partial [Bacillus sp. SIMBA_008]|uniref:formyltransferase family protein n=1 Tax=Bacillus sp. SIMBA_008 TaxID=3085757 RepID=UPI00397C36BA
MQRALIAGDRELGASVFQLVPELDAGDVFAMRTIVVAPTATAEQALETLARDGAELTAEVVDAIAN